MIARLERYGKSLINDPDGPQGLFVLAEIASEREQLLIAALKDMLHYDYPHSLEARMKAIHLLEEFEKNQDEPQTADAANQEASGYPLF